MTIMSNTFSLGHHFHMTHTYNFLAVLTPFITVTNSGSWFLMNDHLGGSHVEKKVGAVQLVFEEYLEHLVVRLERHF